MDPISAASSVGITELKANPTAVLEAAGDQPMAILNRNKPVDYLLTVEVWAKIQEMLEDKELLHLAAARMSDGQKPVRVTLDDL
jgi:antitoxin StbD